MTSTIYLNSKNLQEIAEKYEIEWNEDFDGSSFEFGLDNAFEDMGLIRVAVQFINKNEKDNILVLAKKEEIYQAILDKVDLNFVKKLDEDRFKNPDDDFIDHYYDLIELVYPHIVKVRENVLYSNTVFYIHTVIDNMNKNDNEEIKEEPFKYVYIVPKIDTKKYTFDNTEIRKVIFHDFEGNFIRYKENDEIKYVIKNKEFGFFDKEEAIHCLKGLILYYQNKQMNEFMEKQKLEKQKLYSSIKIV